MATIDQSSEAADDDSAVCSESVETAEGLNCIVACQTDVKGQQLHRHLEQLQDDNKSLRADPVRLKVPWPRRVMQGRFYARSVFCKVGFLQGLFLQGRFFARSVFCKVFFCKVGFLQGWIFARSGFCSDKLLP